jgi:serine/threonine-protein kinase
MEFITGKELKDYFDRGERFPIPTAVRIMTEILSALELAHRHGIVHRDIKPGNIYLSRMATRRWPTSASRDGVLDLTQVGISLGTPPYMSPEQFTGDTLDGRSDLFSAAIILYQFLTERAPLPGQPGEHDHAQRARARSDAALEAQLPGAGGFRRGPRQGAREAAGRALRHGARVRRCADAAAAGHAGRAAPGRLRRHRSQDDDPPFATRRQASEPARRTVVVLGVAAAFLLAIFCGLWLSQLLKANRAPQSPPPTVATKEPAPSPAATVASAAPKPFDPVQALERVFEARDRDHRVSVVPREAAHPGRKGPPAISREQRQARLCVRADGRGPIARSSTSSSRMRSTRRIASPPTRSWTCRARAGR